MVVWWVTSDFRFVDVDKRFQLGQFGPRAGREFNPIYRSDRRKDQSGKYPNHANNQQKLEELKCWLSTTPGCIHNSFVFGDSLTSYQLVQGMQETRQRVFDLSQKPRKNRDSLPLSCIETDFRMSSIDSIILVASKESSQLSTDSSVGFLTTPTE